MEAFRILLPLLADVLLRRQAAQCLEPSGKIIGHEEGVEMPLQLVMGFVMIPLHGGIFQRPIHPLHLTVRPRVIGLCEPVTDAMLSTDSIKQVLEGPSVRLVMCKLDAIIG